MIRTSISIALRQLTAHKVYSAINLLGLSVSIAACIMLWAYVRFETSFNSSFPDADRTYQIHSTLYSTAMEPYMAHGDAFEFANAVPGVTHFARMHWNEGLFEFVADDGSKIAHSVAPVQFVDESFLDMFPQTLVSGDLKDALRAPNSLVLTREIASKFFQNAEDAIGKHFQMKSEWMHAELVVTAVVEDNPDNTTIKFSGLVPIDPLIQSSFYVREPKWNNFFTFLKLEPGVDIQQVYQALPKFITQHTAGTVLTYAPEIYLQPVRDIHFTHGDPRLGPDRLTVNLLLMVSAFILVIAWVNYVNLSTARAIERAREVGIKKALGVLRTQLVTQFMIEALVMNLISLTMAILLSIAFVPMVNEITGLNISFQILDPIQIMILFMVLLVGAIASGVYPAFVLSSFNTADVIKGSVNGGGHGVTLRKVLVIAQFSCSLCLIIGTWAMTKQIVFMLHADKGVNTEGVLVLSGPENVPGDLGEAMRSFKHSMENLTAVERVTTSGVVPGGNYNWGTHMDVAGRAPGDAPAGENTYVIFVDSDFLATYKMQVAEGRAWDPLRTSDMRGVLINQATLGAFHLGTAEQAIGERLVFGKDTLEIIGVLRNYYWESLKVAHRPLVMWPVDIYARRVSLRFHGDPQDMIAEAQRLFNRHFPGNPFSYYFADTFYDRQYQADISFGKIFTLFSALAMMIACSGLFGLTTYTVYLRRREISIRKVLGASVGSILGLMSMQFARLLILAAALAIPLSLWGIVHWLDNYPVRIDISIWLFILPSMMLLMFGMLPVGFQVLRGASESPAKVLRES